VDKGTDLTRPPLVVLGGTAQTIDTFAPHINQIAKSRRLIIPELRGQGRTELSSKHCTIQQLVEDLGSILNALGVEEIHLSGFSFGGRVALAYAAHQPQRVERLAVTAIPLVRPPLGKVILESWMDGLSRGNMRECAWSFIINGYSTEFLEKNAERLSLYVDMVTNSNDPKKVFDLIDQSGRGSDEQYSIPYCASRVKCPTLVIGATQDRIAGLQPVKDLAAAMTQAEFVPMGTGHLAPFEDPAAWRTHLMQFMNR
jgi:pimeloyl-ACP methyl ester carboxylesterase